VRLFIPFRWRDDVPPGDRRIVEHCGESVEQGLAAKSAAADFLGVLLLDDMRRHGSGERKEAT